MEISIYNSFYSDNFSASQPSCPSQPIIHQILKQLWHTEIVVITPNICCKNSADWSIFSCHGVHGSVLKTFPIISHSLRNYAKLYDCFINSKYAGYNVLLICYVVILYRFYMNSRIILKDSRRMVLFYEVFIVPYPLAQDYIYSYLKVNCIPLQKITHISI